MSRTLIAIPLVGLSMAIGGQRLEAQNWKDRLDGAIRAVIAPTHASSDGDRIINYGTALIVQKEGVSAGPSRDHVMLTNHAKDGVVRQASGFLVAMANKKTNRDYTVGEKVYMTHLDVSDNNITVSLLSSATTPVTVKGNTEQTRYKANLKFDFPDGYLATADPGQVLAAINQVLKVEGASNQPATIKLGQTTQEVEAALGKPDRILDLGAKLVWIYKDIKVTFTDGKVSDVQ